VVTVLSGFRTLTRFAIPLERSDRRYGGRPGGRLFYMNYQMGAPDLVTPIPGTTFGRPMFSNDPD